MKKLIAAVLVGTMVLSMAGCGSKKAETTGSEASSDAAAGGTLVMATNAEFPPYEYYEGDNVVGIDADIAAAVADKLGMELKIEDMAFDSIIPAVTSGKADIGLAGMTVTEDRLENVDFSDTYAHATQVVIVKEDSNIASPDDLEGKRLVYSLVQPVIFMQVISKMQR